MGAFDRRSLIWSVGLHATAALALVVAGCVSWFRLRDDDPEILAEFVVEPPGDPEAADPVERESSRPDAAVICYGAFTYVSAIQGWLLRGVPAMFGRDYNEAVYLAPEKNVTVDCPPFYIWQPMSDDGRHGMTLATSLQEAGIPYELHIFQSGFHGNCLNDGENDGHRSDPHSAHWTELCAEWLRFNGLE